VILAFQLVILDKAREPVPTPATLLLWSHKRRLGADLTPLFWARVRPLARLQLPPTQRRVHPIGGSVPRDNVDQDEQKSSDSDSEDTAVSPALSAPASPISSGSSSGEIEDYEETEDPTRDAPQPQAETDMLESECPVLLPCLFEHCVAVTSPRCRQWLAMCFTGTPPLPAILTWGSALFVVVAMVQLYHAQLQESLPRSSMSLFSALSLYPGEAKLYLIALAVYCATFVALLTRASGQIIVANPQLMVLYAVSLITTVVLLIHLVTCSAYPVGASLMQEFSLRTMVNVYTWVVVGLFFPASDVAGYLPKKLVYGLDSEDPASSTEDAGDNTRGRPSRFSVASAQPR